jgi:ADP-ribosylglycohydrolase
MPDPGSDSGWISLEERARGCILGGAIGDALGAPVEFDGIDDVRRRFGPAGVTDYAAAYGRTGAITDDTQMTLFTAHGLIRASERFRGKGIVSVPAMIDSAYAVWLATQGEESRRWPGGRVERVAPFSDMRAADVAALYQRRAPGRTCLSALRAERMGTVEEPLNDSKGCGGVMRVAPVGLAKVGDDAFELGCDIAAITHGHPSGYLAGGALAELIARICDNLTLDMALDRVQGIVRRRWRHEEMLQALVAARALAASQAAPGPETIATLGAGWVAEEALAISVYCALRARDFAHGVLLAVNHSGDSDSTGAITGNILGALLGYAALPSAWLQGLELRDTIERLCRDFIAEFFDRAPDDSAAIGLSPPQ